MRRLPVYLLLDQSGSMAGEPIEAARVGVECLLRSLRSDPYALETVWLSVIVFDSEARQLAPLAELMQFQAPALKATGTTAMGAALELLARCVTTEVTRTTAGQKGDWKPIVFLLTDGRSTDDLERGIAALKQARLGMLVACAAGPEADTGMLQRITNAVVHLDTLDSSSIRAFFQWVSASIATTSQKVDLTKKDVGGLAELPPPPPEVNVVL